MKYLLVLLFAILFMSVKAIEEDSAEEIQQEEKEQENKTQEPVAENNPGQFTFKNDGESTIQEQMAAWQENMQNQEAHQKNSVAICLIMAKSRIQAEQKSLSEILKKREKDGQALYRKIQIEHVTTCMQTVKGEELNILAKEINENKFDIKNYEQKFMELPFSSYEDEDYNLELSEEDLKIEKITIDWEKEWQEQQDKQKKKDQRKKTQGNKKRTNIKYKSSGKKNPEEDTQQNQQQQQKQGPSDGPETRLFGISFKDIPATFKFLLIISVAGGVFFIVQLGLKQVGQETITLRTKSQIKKSKKQ